MKDGVRRPWQPFAVAAALVLIATLFAFRLPESLLLQIERNGPFSQAQADWAYRMIALAAIVQAAFVGLVVLSIDKVQETIEKEPRLTHMSKQQVADSLSRSAAGMSLLTLAYGLSALFISGRRGGFWLFVAVTVAQLAWYFRRIGVIAHWFEFQPEPTPERIRSVWRREPPDYCPPLARGLTDRSSTRS